MTRQFRVTVTNYYEHVIDFLSILCFNIMLVFPNDDWKSNVAPRSNAYFRLYRQLIITEHMFSRFTEVALSRSF